MQQWGAKEGEKEPMDVEMVEITMDIDDAALVVDRGIVTKLWSV